MAQRRLSLEPLTKGLKRQSRQEKPSCQRPQYLHLANRIYFWPLNSVSRSFIHSRSGQLRFLFSNNRLDEGQIFAGLPWLMRPAPR